MKKILIKKFWKKIKWKKILDEENSKENWIFFYIYKKW